MTSTANSNSKSKSNSKLAPESSSAKSSPVSPKPKVVVSARVSRNVYAKLYDYTIKGGYRSISETVAGILEGHFAPKRSKAKAGAGGKSKGRKR